jgi:hypothetical protein
VSTATLNTRVHDFIVTHRQLFIDRQLSDAKPAKTIKTVNPAPEQTLATIADDGPWSRMTPSERLRRAARSSTVGGR